MEKGKMDKEKIDKEYIDNRVELLINNMFKASLLISMFIMLGIGFFIDKEDELGLIINMVLIAIGLIILLFIEPRTKNEQ